ncbi:N-acetyltransferase family protein [Sedimentitalea sp. XS_ASV28]|uniref:GNAT family N-acetyltransferase n=1 Tax=Sedimentitalea sp. XS_ASV28 TaxID=3241296 RepID=UPI003510E7E5
MKPIEINPASPSDYDEIADVWHASASLPGVGPVPMFSRETLRNRIEPEVANGWRITLARTGGKIIGFLAVCPEQRVLSQIFVRPDFIGRGLGSCLLRLAMAQMPSGFTLSTASTNTDARKFYERSGLTMTGTDVHPRAGHAISYYEWAGR